MAWFSFLIGVLCALPVAVLLALWLHRNSRRAAAERARSTEHLVELAKLTGGLAHEIRNPLSAIKLNLRLLAEDLGDGEGDRDRRSALRLGRVQDEVERLHSTLEEFLRYAGKMELHCDRQDLRRLVEEIVDFYRPQAEAAHLVLRQSLPPGPVLCRVDAALFKQAVLNLLINATQAVGEGDPGELMLRLSAQGGRAALEVIDNGPGIRPEDRQRIFDAYYTTRPGGSGLGLPLTKRIVFQHHGDIRVDGEPGTGTRFLVSLPLAGES